MTNSPEHKTILDIDKALKTLTRVPLDPTLVRLNGDDIDSLRRAYAYSPSVIDGFGSAFLGIPYVVDNDLSHGQFVFEYHGQMQARIVLTESNPQVVFSPDLKKE